MYPPCLFLEIGVFFFHGLPGRVSGATLQAPASGAPAELRRMAQELMEMAEQLEAMEPWDG